MPDNQWAKDLLESVNPNFYGRIELEFRAGQVRKITRSESYVSPETAEQHARAFEKSVEGARPLRAHDFSRR
jgi:hypothetical protein